MSEEVSVVVVSSEQPKTCALFSVLNLFWFRGGSEEAKERDRVLVECVVPELDVENFEEELHGEEVDDEDAGAAEVDAADGNGKQQRLKETLTVGGKGEALSLHGRDWCED